MKIIFMKNNYLLIKINENNLNSLIIIRHYLSSIMRKVAFCIRKNKDADQLRGLQP